MTKYYVDPSGKYLGGFDGSQPPIGSIEVASPPEDGRMVWNGTWSWPAGLKEQLMDDEADSMLALKVLRAMTDINYQFIKNPSLFSTPADYRQAIKNRFKTLNGG